MKKLQRGDAPRHLKKNIAARTKKFLAELRADPKARPKDSYKSKTVLDSLSKSQFSKCAYCESTFSETSFKRVDHFRPVIDFPRQAFVWENLLLSCEACNQCKLDKFPSDAEGGPIINPYEEDPHSHFKYIYIISEQNLEIQHLSKRGETSKLVYGLLRADLTLARNERVREFLVIQKLASDGSNEAKDLLRQISNENQRYSSILNNLSVSA